MAHQINWSKEYLERFIELACLTDEEIDIMKTRIAGWTITKQSMQLGMSTAKISNMIARLKVKYDNVQKNDPILPPRKFSVKETYMDTH